MGHIYFTHSPNHLKLHPRRQSSSYQTSLADRIPCTSASSSKPFREGSRSDYFKYIHQRGSDYSRKAINRGAVNIRGNRYAFTTAIFSVLSGFTEGHALGSLDHEMNNAGAGYMNAVYVLRKVLQDANKKADIVATMKWYNDFGEIYQNPFEFAGTTADRMRTIALWR